MHNVSMKYNKPIKYFLVMKLTFLLLLAGMLNVSANVYAQRISLTVKKASFESVLMDIQRQSGYNFLFKAEYFDQARPVTLSVKNKDISEVLPALMASQPFDYQINGNIITLLPKAKINLPSEAPKRSQQEVTGRITDSLGNPLAGVSISVKETKLGVTTDADGRFRLAAKPGDILVCSNVGYIPQEVQVDASLVVSVVLKEEKANLDEVVVVAYGTQRKESVIGAITTITPGKLDQPVSKVSSSLAGQLAGIVAIQSSGEPGTGAQFWIRGVSTFGANSTPLILVDGIERPLDLVDPEDIESFSILKDATATAVYGVRGANGIVLVTTKRGKDKDKPTINARYERGYLEPTRMVKMANAEQWMDYYNDISFEGTQNVPFPDHVKQLYLTGADPDLYPNVDWMDAIFKPGTTNQRMNLNVTGGGRVARYYVSGSHLRENGIFEPVVTPNYNPEFNYQRFNFRSNLDINLTSSTVLSLNLSNQYERRNRLGVDMDVMYRILTSTPPISIPLEYSDGTHAMPLVGNNPYYSLNSTGYSEDFWNTSQSLISVTQDFSELVTPGLQANVKFSWDAVNAATLDKRKSPATFYATGRDEAGNLIFHQNTDGSDYLSLARSNRGNRTINLEASTTYNRNFADRHRVGGLILFSMREHTDNFPGDFIAAFPYRNIGIASRVTYSFLDRYFIEGNFGYNGSENFAPGKRFGLFPSLALGYILTNEPFFKDLTSTISLLKVRGSIGEIGNDQIGGNRRFAY
ncbi:MAG: SusC/RagA family TonB-linked outer membrane protein, partial [Parapedobacter sp.]